VATGARLGMLGNTGVMDAAFNITAFTTEQIADQGARTVADVLANDPSVRFTSNSGHMVENFTIRGFDLASNDIALNGLYGLLPAQHVAVEFVERIELLKGPNALLGGMSPNGNVGGMVNLVPKRAGNTPLTELTTSYSSGSYGQVHLDVARRLGAEQRLGVRFNGVYGQGETGVDGQEKGRRLGAVALDYRGDGWKLALDAYANKETIDNGSPGMYDLASRVGRIVTPPDADSNMFRGTEGRSESNGIAVRADVDLTRDISAYATFGVAESNSHGLLFGTRVVVTNANGTANGFVYNLANIAHARTAEAGLKAALQTGGIKHTLTAAVSTIQYEYWNANVARTGWTQNIYNPVTPPFPAGPTTVPQTRDDEYSGLAVADTLHFFDDKLLLTLGARLQDVEQYNPATPAVSRYEKSTVTPALAVVYKPWGEQVSFYGNYIEGLSPGTTVGVGYTNTGTALSPYKTQQTELGLKLRHGEFSHTFSLFRITKPSAIDITNSDGSKTLAADGEQLHRGFEWNVSGRLLPTLSLLGGYAYTKAEYERAATAALTGKQVIGVPTQALVLGADWQTPLRGLSLNGRVTRTGEQWLNQANTLRLPAWTRVDLGAKYDTVVASLPVVLRAAVENVEDKNDWVGVFGNGFATLSSPRTVRVSATVSF
jgi:iron complex outermembrane receptor protein